MTTFNSGCVSEVLIWLSKSFHSLVAMLSDWFLELKPFPFQVSFVILNFVMIVAINRFLNHRKVRVITSLFSNEDGVLRKPNADLPTNKSASTFFIQPKSLLTTGSITFLAIELINLIFLLTKSSGSAVSPDQSGITVAVCSVSILFPVTLLVIEKWEDGLSSISKSQTMLNHSAALPIGIALMAGTARLAFPIDNTAASLIAAASVLGASWVFYRLVEIVLFPSKRKAVESLILRDQVFRTVQRSAEDRAGYSLTEKYFSENQVSGIEQGPYHFRDKQKYESLFHVTAEYSGVVSQIDVKTLISIYRKILAEISPESPLSSSQSTETNPPVLPLKLLLKSYVGQEADGKTSLVEIEISQQAKLKVKVPVNVDAHTESIRNCFKFDNSPEQGLILEQFEDFCNELRIIALKAAKENDVNQIPSLERYLEAWLDALAESFKSLEVKYDLQSAKGEHSNSFFNPNADWKPLRKAIDIIEQVGTRALKADQSDRPEFAKGILDLTISLFRRMARADEMLSSNQLLWSNLRLVSGAMSDKHLGAAWLMENSLEDFESFIKYFLVPKIEEDSGPVKEQDQALQLIKAIFSVSQEQMRAALLAKQHGIYGKVLRFLMKHPQLFRYQDVHHPIKRLEFLRDHGGSTPENEKALEILQNKVNTIEIINQWRDEILVGQGVLILLAYNGEARGPDAAYDINETVDFTRLLIPYLASSMKKALTLLINAREDKFENNWSWKHWEYIPNIDDDESGAKWMQFRTFQDQFLALSLIRAAAVDSQPVDITDELLMHDLRFNLSVGDNSILKKLDENIAIAIKLNFVEEAQAASVKVKIQTYLNSYVERAEKNWINTLVTLPLDKRVIEEIPGQFDSAFLSAAKMRSLLSFKSVHEADKTKLSKNQWGSNKLYQRELFVSSPGYQLLRDMGTTYGSGFARSEDSFAFVSILDQCPPINKMSLDDALTQAEQAKLPLEKLLILTSRHPDFMNSLKKNPAYEASYRFTKDVLDAYPHRPDGFYLKGDLKIPIYQFFLNNGEAKDGFIVTLREAVLIEQTTWTGERNSSLIPKSGFNFEVRDPLLDEELRTSLITENRDWLKDVPAEEKEKMTALYVGISFFQRIELVVIDKTNVITAKFLPDDIED